MSDSLTIWTIYYKPADINRIQARRFDVCKDGKPKDTGVTMLGELENLREHFRQHGLYCMPRDTKDDPTVIESWL